jgi:hypothetical protein
MTRRRYWKSSQAIRELAIKQLDLGSTLKGISTLRKSLIDADRQVKLTCDDLEDMRYSSPTIDSATGLPIATDDPMLEQAIECIRSISDHLSEAVRLSDEAKRTIRGEFSQPGGSVVVSDIDDLQQTIDPSDSLAQRRAMIRKRRYGR